MDTYALLDIIGDEINNSRHKAFFVLILKQIGQNLLQYNTPDNIKSLLLKISRFDQHNQQQQILYFNQFKQLLIQGKFSDYLTQNTQQRQTLSQIQKNWKSIENLFIIQNFSFSSLKNWISTKFDSQDLNLDQNQIQKLAIEYLHQIDYIATTVLKKDGTIWKIICLKDQQRILIGNQSDLLNFDSQTTVQITRKQSNLTICELPISGIGKAGIILQQEEQQILKKQIFRLGQSILIVIGLQDGVLTLWGHTLFSDFQGYQQCKPEDQQFTIGKNQECSISFEDDDTLSDIHAKIKFCNQKWKIQPVNSSKITVLFHQYQKEDNYPSATQIVPHRCNLMIDNTEIELFYQF